MSLKDIAPQHPFRCLGRVALVAVAICCGSFLVSKAAAAIPAQGTAPAPTRAIYSETANAKSDITAAEVTARKYRRNIILDFGGNWCGDCQVLDLYMHQSPNLQLIQQNFVVVHIDVGRYDKNLDLAAKYNIPLKKGVPALAVLNPAGRILYSQKTGEFEKMGSMEPSSVTVFLDKWKPSR